MYMRLATRWVVEHRTATGHEPGRVDAPIVDQGTYLPEVALALASLNDSEVRRSDLYMFAELALGVDDTLLL